MGLLSSEIDAKAMVPICRQLATTYEAGIPITKAINHVSSHTKDPKVRKVLREIGDDLGNGKTLADATRKQSKYLSPFFIQLLASGEQGGHLDVMLQDLASYYEDKLTMQRAIVAAMAYPVLLLIIAWFLGSFAIGMVKEALAGMNDSTRGGVSGVMEYFNQYAQFQLRMIVLFAIGGAILIVLSRMGALKWITGAVTTHLWPIAKVTRYFGMARFFRSFALLIGSGLGVTKCIEGAASVTTNAYIERDLLQAVPRIKKGDSLVEAFSQSRYMTPLAREMLAIGEESGNLDEHMKKAAEYHLKEANQAVKVAMTTFTTLLMLAVFAVVGGIIIYFWTNLYGGIMNDLGI